MWDSTFQTAVLLRRDKVIAQLDEQFTRINQMFAAMEYDASKNYKTVARMDAKLTMLDSINGDKQYPMDADVEMLQSGGTVNLKLTMDLSALLEIPGALDGMDPLSAAAVKGQLRNVKMEMIYDAEGGTLYLKDAAAGPAHRRAAGRGQLDRLPCGRSYPDARGDQHHHGSGPLPEHAAAGGAHAQLWILLF